MLVMWLLRRFIRRTWGNRCPDFCAGCCACEAWLAYDRLTERRGWPDSPDCKTHEATERYIAYMKGMAAMVHPRELPYTHLEVSTGAAQFNQRAWNKDAHTLARAYVADLHRITGHGPEWEG